MHVQAHAHSLPSSYSCNCIGRCPGLLTSTLCKQAEHVIHDATKTIGHLQHEQLIPWYGLHGVFFRELMSVWLINDVATNLRDFIVKVGCLNGFGRLYILLGGSP
jgi:hypothetical protein